MSRVVLVDDTGEFWPVDIPLLYSPSRIASTGLLYFNWKSYKDQARSFDCVEL